MAEPIRIDFGTGSDPGRFGFEAGPIHTNAYVVQTQEGKGPNGLAYYASDGYDEFSTDYEVAGGKAFRGVIDFEDGCLALMGNELVHIDSAGGGTTIGGISGSSRAIFARNNAATAQAVFTVDGAKWVTTKTGPGAFSLAEITDADLPSSNSCTFLNQRIIYGIDDGRFFWSDVNDATAINAANFATAEGNPDGVTRVFAHHQELWVFGRQTTEVWRDTGATTAPFRRNSGAVIEKGSIAPHSIAALDKDLIWLGQDGTVYRAQGYGFARISEHGIEEDIDDTVDKAGIIAFTRLIRGHHFYTLVSDNWTWEWNRTTERWTKRESKNLDRWRVEGSCGLGDDITTLYDYDKGLVYKVNEDTYAEGDDIMTFTLRSAPLHAYPERLSVYRLYCDFKTGVGTVDAGDAHASNPQVMMRYSDDGGSSWSNELTRDLGKIGTEGTTRVAFDRLGITGRTGRIWELSCSSPVIRAMTYAAIEADVVGT